MAATTFRCKLLHLHEAGPRKQNPYYFAVKVLQGLTIWYRCSYLCEASPSQSDSNLLAEAIVGALTLNYEPTTSDANIILYISGTIARSLVRATKCNFCKQSLISEDNPDHAEIKDPTKIEAAVMLPMHCWKVFKELCCSTELMAQILSISGQRYLILKLTDRATYNQRFIHLLFWANLYSSGHNLKEQIMGRSFNCMEKPCKGSNHQSQSQTWIRGKQKKNRQAIKCTTLKPNIISSYNVVC